ncbi:MAG: amidohydrolase [Bacteroidota bacterium]
MQNIKITILQSNLYWENINKNLELFSQKISLIKEKTDLIVLPEMFNTGFTMNNKTVAERMGGKTFEWMKKIAKEKNCVVTGSIIIEDSLSDKKSNGVVYFNRLIWMRQDGSFEIYDKRHLFRYANEQNFYTAGNKKLIVELNGWKICPMICYDLRFPVWIRNRFSLPSFASRGIIGCEEYDVLIFVANWPERRNYHWKTLLLVRAIENQCYIVGVNRIGNDGNNVYYSGDSAVINPKGEIISKTEPHQESVESIFLSRKELDEWRKTFPAWMDADQFTLSNSQQ